MPVKIRLARRGRRKNPYYHIVIADARAPRDGKFIENIGFYNPMTVPATIEVDRERAYEWLMKGAQPTNTAKAILRFKGVYYKKHLMRGVAKGALTEEAAQSMYQEWIDAKESKIAARVEETKKKKEERLKMLSGEIKPLQKTADKEAGDAFREAEVAEAPAAEADQPAAEVAETPATPEEAPVEETKAEAPAAQEVTEEVAAAAPVVETPKVEEEAAKEEAPAPEAVEQKPDDLTKIEGIGPAIAKLLAADGILTFADLSQKDPEAIKQILANAGGNFSMHDPTTWPKQGDMAAKGEWDALKKWQDELDGGKEVTTSSEEE